MTAIARSRAWSWSGLLLAIFVGLAARLVPWNMTFTTQGVRFRTDTDPYYHVLRARRIVASWPRVPWTDPDMNFPYGAQIPWPPLFDFTIAALARSAGATAADPARVALVAALFALVIGLALLPLVAWLGKRLLGGGLWLDAALLVALLPANIRYGAVGAADQHGAELLLSCGIFLAFVSSWRSRGDIPPRRWAGPVTLGVLIAAAFWNWLGSALYLLVLVGVTGLWFVVARAGDAAARAMARALFFGCLLGTATLAVSIALLAPPGTLGSGGLNGLTGLHVAMCGVSAAFGGLLLAVGRRAGSHTRFQRLLEAMGAGMLSVLPVLASAPLREGIGRGLTALLRGDPWYTSIAEYCPILFSGTRSLGHDLRTVFDAFGLGLFVMPFALVPMWRRWRQGEADRPALFFVFFWGSTMLVLTLAELRFQLYLVIPMAFWICLALRDLAELAARSKPLRAIVIRVAAPLAGVLLISSPALHDVWTGGYAIQQRGFESDLFPALEWLRKVPSADSSRPAVMAEWAVGHAVQYFAAKPVIVTPFGTALDEGMRAPEHPSGMEDWAAFLFTSRPEAAEAVLARRRVGFALLGSPKAEVITSFGFAPPGTPPVADLKLDWLKGPIPSLWPEFLRLIASRLYYFDGVSQDGSNPALDRFRLLYESSSTERIGNLRPTHLYKVFSVVPAARIALRGAPPGGIVTASARIQTNQNRVFEWVTRSPAGADGRAELRLPYATGANGLVEAGPYSVTDGIHRGTLDLDEKDVLGGKMDIDLGGDSRS